MIGGKMARATLGSVKSGRGAVATTVALWLAVSIGLVSNSVVASVPAAEPPVDYRLPADTALSFKELDQLQLDLRRSMSRYLIAYGPLTDVIDSRVTVWAEAVSEVFRQAGEFDGLWRHPGKAVNLFELRDQCAEVAIARDDASAVLDKLGAMEEEDRQTGWSAGTFSPNLHQLKLAAVAAVRLNLGLCSGSSVIRGGGLRPAT